VVARGEFNISGAIGPFLFFWGGSEPLPAPWDGSVLWFPRLRAWGDGIVSTLMVLSGTPVLASYVGHPRGTSTWSMLCATHCWADHPNHLCRQQLFQSTHTIIHSSFIPSSIHHEASHTPSNTHGIQSCDLVSSTLPSLSLSCVCAWCDWEIDIKVGISTVHARGTRYHRILHSQCYGKAFAAKHSSHGMCFHR
jgi:hypothetical protein